MTMNEHRAAAEQPSSPSIIDVGIRRRPRDGARAYSLAAVLLLLPACVSAPPTEVMVAVDAQRGAWQAAEANFRTVVEAYHRELFDAYGAHLEAAVEHAITTATDTRPQAAADTAKAALKRLREIEADLDKKRREFLSSDVFAVGAKLNETASQYVRAVDESARRVAEIVEQLKGLKK